jgi:hypothetical protein
MATWVYLVAGAVVGIALGIVVSVVTDIPFAPEGGLALGLLAGWLVSRQRSSRTS